jgi:rhamnogalacturonan endolyase
MNISRKVRFVASVGLLLLAGWLQAAPYLMEKLNRGVVAVRSTSTQIYVGWRLLGTDPANVAFNVYRAADGGAPVKLNATPLTTTTNYVDEAADFTTANAYTVRAVLGDVEQAPSEAFTVPANAAIRQYLSVPIQPPPSGTVTAPGTGNYTYSANDASVGDLDGDGQYDIVLKWDPSNSRDTASTGYSGNCILDGYKMDGTRLWRIDLGRNIRAGAHYTQFIVYDLDGDGRAEIACKTADGTIDGLGNVIGDPTVDWRSHASGTLGRVLAGPEYFTIFDGLTGKALATTTYIPGRDPINGWGGIGGNGNNDSVGNRVDRFLACVAYLDGVRPSVVMCRGYYGRSVLAAWDWRNGELTSRWVFDSVNGANAYSGQGGHHVFVADVDDDGKQEIVYHSAIIDDDGTGYLSTRDPNAASGWERWGLRHGDAGHLSDLDPTRPGLEVFGVHESEGNTVPFGTPGMAVYSAKTGEVYWGIVPGVDVGRGVAADIDPTSPGAESWGPGGANAGVRRMSDGSRLYQGTATPNATPNSTNMLVWWDADLLRELEDGIAITKWNWTNRTTQTLLTATGSASNNGTKSNPALIADLFGDWREEVMWRNSNSTELRIYTTTIPANNRIHTLMHDAQYRSSVAWQNVGYNQPPWPSFWIGENPLSSPPPPPPIVVENDTTPPVLNLPDDKIVEATSPAGAAVTFAVSAEDEVSGSLAVTLSHASGSVFPIGTTMVTASATDAFGNVVNGSFTITVQDTIAPTIYSLVVSPTELWPANHKMVNVTVTPVVSDAGDNAPVTRILSVTSNEPVNGTGDGNTEPDWLITGDLTLQLRAERAGNNSSRIYTITVQTRDAAGNATTRTITVRVPHDRR